MTVLPESGGRSLSGSTDVFECVACGTRVAAAQLVELKFQCPQFTSADDRDHVLEPRRSLTAPGAATVTCAWPDRNPFVSYRERLTAYRMAREYGLSDEALLKLIHAFDAAVARIDDRGFVQTPLVRSPALDQAAGFDGPGGVWIKDETQNVSGSHKARHLAGIMLYLEAFETMRAAPRAARPHLAIASCGNAALAAAVVAGAAGWPLQVFVPPSADAAVMRRLRALGAGIVVCQRAAGETGDPCYRRFHDAVSAGALPFCCQGPDNGLTIEGGETLVWEMLQQLEGQPLDRLFVQVGGGALASACVRGLVSGDAEPRQPVTKVHAVQTAGAFPLARAWARVACRALEDLQRRYSGEGPGRGRTAADIDDQLAVLKVIGAARGDDEGSLQRACGVSHTVLAAVARTLSLPLASRDVRAALDEAAQRRRAFMWPWEVEPRSAAHGILDDETYDWRTVVAGMVHSGGWPVIVTEDEIERANVSGRMTTGIDVDHTGSAGLAGLLALVERDPGAGPRVVGPHERVAVIFSGAKRHE